MPGRRGRTGFPVRSGAVHNKEWEVTAFNDTALDNGIGQAIIFTPFTNDRSETLLRMRGLLTVETGSPVAANERVLLGCGIAVVSATAAAAGAVPLPVTDGAYPWLWHGWLKVSTLAAAAEPNFRMSSIEVDSKAMRKMKEEEVIICVFEVGESTDQGGNVIVGGGLRALVGF